MSEFSDRPNIYITKVRRTHPIQLARTMLLIHGPYPLGYPETQRIQGRRQWPESVQFASSTLAPDPRHRSSRQITDKQQLSKPRVSESDGNVSERIIMRGIWRRKG